MTTEHLSRLDKVQDVIDYMKANDTLCIHDDIEKSVFYTLRKEGFTKTEINRGPSQDFQIWEKKNVANLDIEDC